jgi:hypothetical protein
MIRQLTTDGPGVELISRSTPTGETKTVYIGVNYRITHTYMGMPSDTPASESRLKMHLLSPCDYATMILDPNAH